jgi:hypothetical protein
MSKKIVPEIKKFEVSKKFQNPLNQEPWVKLKHFVLKEKQFALGLMPTKQIGKFIPEWEGLN